MSNSFHTIWNSIACNQIQTRIKLNKGGLTLERTQRRSVIPKYIGRPTHYKFTTEQDIWQLLVEYRLIHHKAKQ